MSLITPDFGLFFWMVIAFGILVVVLKKFAWKPILNGLHSRETKIAEALAKAEEAKEAIAQLEQKNALLAHEAQQERERLVSEAKFMRDQIVEQAREEARRQAESYMESARLAMAQEEKELRRDLRREVAELAIKTTERILRERFTDPQAQYTHVNKLVDELMSH